jgi:phenylalanine-4-hydroxylase
VEFGLIRREEGLRIYGAGILSSRTESVYCLEDPAPQRLAFDLTRVMRTEYRIDRFQDTYFVIDGFDQLFAETRPDFTPLYRKLAALDDIAPDASSPGDREVMLEAV